MLRDGIGVPLGGVILMLMPAVIVRVLRPPTRESLDGFMIGVLGALTFTAAATLTRLAPQFGTGVVSKRPMESLLVEAGIRGVAVPLVAAAAGGLIGAALWFTRPPSRDQHPGAVRFVLVALAARGAGGVPEPGTDRCRPLPAGADARAVSGVGAGGLLVLRVGLHLALLHEAHDEIQSDEPLLCTHCGHVVPDMAFCPACGVATRASSRSSRKSRRDARPVREEAGPEEP